MALEPRTPGYVARKITKALENLPIDDERRSRLPGLVAIFVSLDPSWSVTAMTDQTDGRHLRVPQPSDVATLVAHTYLQLTGKTKMSCPDMALGHPSKRRAAGYLVHESFMTLMTDIFDALQISESPSHYAVRIAESYKDR